MLLRDITSVLFLYLSYFLKKNWKWNVVLFQVYGHSFFFIQDTLAEFSFAFSSRTVRKNSHRWWEKCDIRLTKSTCIFFLEVSKFFFPSAMTGDFSQVKVCHFPSRVLFPLTLYSSVNFLPGAILVSSGCITDVEFCHLYLFSVLWQPTVLW